MSPDDPTDASLVTAEAEAIALDSANRAEMTPEQLAQHDRDCELSAQWWSGYDTGWEAGLAACGVEPTAS